MYSTLHKKYGMYINYSIQMYNYYVDTAVIMYLLETYYSQCHVVWVYNILSSHNGGQFVLG